MSGNTSRALIPSSRPVQCSGWVGVLLPAEEVREFAIFFYQLKCQLLAWDINHENPRSLPPYQWEKKGSKLFTTRNVTQYRSLRQATFRLLNHIRKIGGYVIYAGEHKTGPARQHDATKTFRRQLLHAVRTIDRYCTQSRSTFMLLLDEQRAGNEWREQNVEACTLAMFEDPAEKMSEPDRAAAAGRKPPLPDPAMRRLDLRPCRSFDGNGCLARGISRLGAFRQVLLDTNRRGRPTGLRLAAPARRARKP
ncbi:hypothetical protein PPS11_13946 [Pseudomonas putida S11]|nr:hypothetical protein PPS11_13946 [Pseudomonas putida S11]